MIDFIGIGAQKSGTSWLYACLYEHPEICAPIKELHFFSRPRYKEGIAWYESHFTRCAEGTKKGEFSTSYLYSTESAARIKEHYPEVKLIAILRSPLERAYSQYRNAIKAGEVEKETTFAEYVEREESAFAQGRYVEQLMRYDEHFTREQLLVMIYEDIERDPLAFVQEVYRFLGVDDSFVPSMLTTRINTARTPKAVGIDRIMHKIAESLRVVGFDKLVFAIKRSGIPDIVRSANTDIGSASNEKPDLSAYAHLVRDDVAALSRRLGRDLAAEWEVQ